MPPLSNATNSDQSSSKPTLMEKDLLSSSSHSTTNHRRSSVTFASSIQIIDEKEDPKQDVVVYTEDVWYNLDEYNVMLKDCLDTVTFMKSMKKDCKNDALVTKKQQLEEQNQVCTRGLEGMSPSGQRRKLKHTMTAWIAVLEEQARQKTENIFDPEVLSDIYLDSSFQCVEKAFTRAIRDCVEVYPECIQ